MSHFCPVWSDQTSCLVIYGILDYSSNVIQPVIVRNLPIWPIWRSFINFLHCAPQGNPHCFSLCSIEGLDGAHFFVIGSVYLIKNAFLAFLNSLPERFARLKIAILCPHSLHLSFKKTAYSFKSMFIYKKSPESLTKLNCKNWIIPKLKVVLFWIHSLHMAFNNKSNLLESIFITKKSLKISLNLNS